MKKRIALAAAVLLAIVSLTWTAVWAGSLGTSIAIYWQPVEESTDGGRTGSRMILMDDGRLSFGRFGFGHRDPGWHYLGRDYPHPLHGSQINHPRGHMLSGVEGPGWSPAAIAMLMAVFFFMRSRKTSGDDGSTSAAGRVPDTSSPVTPVPDNHMQLRRVDTAHPPLPWTTAAEGLA